MMETLGLVDKSLYDLGDNELLDVWDADFATSTPDQDLFRGPSPLGHILSNSSTNTRNHNHHSNPSLWSSMPEVIRNDKLLTDDSNSNNLNQMSMQQEQQQQHHMMSPSSISSSSSSSYTTADSVSSMSPTNSNTDEYNHLDFIVVKKEKNSNINTSHTSSFKNNNNHKSPFSNIHMQGSDGDSLPSSPMSYHEDFEKDCYPCISMDRVVSSQSLLSVPLERSLKQEEEEEEEEEEQNRQQQQQLQRIGFKEEPLSPDDEEAPLSLMEDEDMDEDDEDEDSDEASVVDHQLNINELSHHQAAAPVPTSLGYYIRHDQVSNLGPHFRICNPQSLLKPSTIVLASKPSASNSRMIVPKVNIKLTSTANKTSNDEICTSTETKAKVLSKAKVHNGKSALRMSYSHSTGRQPITTPLISSQPKGSTGPLLLTDEEKRTLLSEGYPVPQRLPLTKQEEKSLKKIRRKIKNKISAQESRRKKKEYMDCLERKMDSLHSELSQYKSRCTSLENQNLSLVQQLKKLQAQLSAQGVLSPQQQLEDNKNKNVTTVTVMAKPLTRSTHVK